MDSNYIIQISKLFPCLNQVNSIYSLYSMLALILLNVEMNKTDRKDQPPRCLHSSEEGEKKEQVFIET